MDENRKPAFLFAGTILLARKLVPMLDVETPDGLIEHYQWRAIHQASRLLEKIHEEWPALLTPTQKPKQSEQEQPAQNTAAEKGHWNKRQDRPRKIGGCSTRPPKRDEPALAKLGITKEISSQAPGKPYLATAITAKVTERQIIVERLN